MLLVLRHFISQLGRDSRSASKLISTGDMDQGFEYIKRQAVDSRIDR